ncbi:CRISPR-associated endonuclease Cas6 [Spirosoma sp. BT702]|uniref:CRISPR-associated endonuclease Cas6 n=1 Tax=Spirosoma profusum TaxID=2771354 RepID=A0A927AU14_9BACT|nr:CRISPR-associated endonuclease Cas6 [Spirosoma profusum]MBD2701922.1 CRISPR-associated endonuclease Cas6 [Spirosoma profusum]
MASQTRIPITTITFPEIALPTRDAHKLRGYFGTLFREHSPLLHNHLIAQATAADSPHRFRYAYPLVQYKVLEHIPTLVGMAEGAELLAKLFLQIRELTIDETHFPVLNKHIRHEQAVIGMVDELVSYRFQTLWMALNQTNYQDYRRYTKAEQLAQLKRVITSQILATFREFGLWVAPHEQIQVQLSIDERTTRFKNQPMVAFTGGFLANIVLPNGVGLGKAVSRGFGSIQRVEG